MCIKVTGLQPEDSVAYSTINAMTTGLIRTTLESSRHDIVDIATHTAKGVDALFDFYKELCNVNTITEDTVKTLKEKCGQLTQLKDFDDTIHALMKLELLPGNLFQGTEYREYVDNELVVNESFVNCALDSKTFMGIDTAYPVDVGQYDSAFSKLDTKVKDFHQQFPDTGVSALDVIGLLKKKFTENTDNSTFYEDMKSVLNLHSRAFHALIVHRRLLNMYTYFYMKAIDLRVKMHSCVVK